MKPRVFDFINDQVIVLYDSTFPVYIIRGEKNFLVDTGTAARATGFAEKIRTVLDSIGAKNETIDTLLLTHSHWDHVGAASYLQENFEFDVYASTRAVEVLQKDSAVAFIGKLNQNYQQMVNDTSGVTVKKLKHMSPLKEWDTLPVSKNSYIEVIETPGHTKCSITYMLYPSRTIFIGDATGVRERDGRIKPIFLSSYTAYENSIQKLIALEAEVVCFPHNMVIKGRERVRKHMDEALDRTHEIRDKIIHMLKEGLEVSDIGEALLNREFDRPTLLGPRESMIINFEAMARSVQKESFLPVP